MKKIIIIVVTLFLTSCIKNYYQIFTASSENSKTKSGLIVFEDKNCTVSYNLWSFQGSSDFVFYNKTDQDITIDFTKTFFVLNEYSNPYYQNKTYSSTLSNKVTANSYYKTYSISKDASTTISYGDQTATVIPSKTKRLISKFQIVDTLFFHCDLVRKATRSNPGTVKFDKSTSPIIFSNIITYKIGEEINKIENKFYVSEVQNIPLKYAYEYKDTVKCGVTNYSQPYFKYQSPNRFYMKYSISN